VKNPSTTGVHTGRWEAAEPPPPPPLAAPCLDLERREEVGGGTGGLVWWSSRPEEEEADAPTTHPEHGARGGGRHASAAPSSRFAAGDRVDAFRRDESGGGSRFVAARVVAFDPTLRTYRLLFEDTGTEGSLRAIQVGGRLDSWMVGWLVGWLDGWLA